MAWQSKLSPFISSAWGSAARVLFEISGSRTHQCAKPLPEIPPPDVLALTLLFPDLLFLAPHPHSVLSRTLKRLARISYSEVLHSSR